MLKKLLNHKLQVALFVVLVGLLASVRIFESQLFYDPFLDFFRSEYTNLPLPDFNRMYLFGSLFFRYFLNTIISLAIIYVVFRDLELVKFASFLYLLFFIGLIITFFIVLAYFGDDNNLTIFYIRRFIIQPIFVVLFLPAFYYQDRLTKNNS